MNMSEYQESAHAFAKYPNTDLAWSYPVLGLAGEAGEVANIVKKVQRIGGPDELTDSQLGEFELKLRDELGDVLWYVAEVATQHGLSLNAIARHNLQKLYERQNKNTITALERPD